MVDLFSNESFLFFLLVNLVAAVGMNLVYMTGQLNVGQAGFMAVGAYAAALVDIHLGWPLIAAVLVGGLAAGLAAWPVALGAVRLRGVYLIMGTVAAGELIRVLLNNFDWVGGGQGLSGIRPASLAEAAISAACIVVAAWFLTISPLGLQMRAIFDDEDAAEAAGVNTRRVKIFAVVVSAAVVGMAGGLLARWLLFIAPRNFGIDLSFRIALFTLVGGVHSLLGAVFGAVALTTLLESLKELGGLGNLPAWASAIGQWRMVIFGGLVMVLMAVRPEGLVTREIALAWGRPLRVWLRRRRARQSRHPEFRREAGIAGYDGNGALESAVFEFSAVSHAFGGVQAVEDLTLTVRSGEILALIGANGAGKTTLTNLAAGRLQLQKGSIRFRGREIGHLRASVRTRSGVTRTFQTVRMFAHLTVEEQIRLGVQARRERPGPRVPEIIEEIGLTGKEDALPEMLSLAEQQRLEIGRVAASMPSVLFLDEPFAGMNEAERRELADLVRGLRDQGTAIVLIDHNLDMVFGVADRVAVVDFGQLIVVASPEEIYRDARVRAAYLGDVEIAV